MKNFIYTFNLHAATIACMIFFATPTTAQTSNSIQIECQVSGSELLMGNKSQIRDIIQIQIFENPIPRIMIKGNKIRLVIIGANATKPSGFKAIGVNRSTEDAWDMTSRDTGPDNWQFENEARINRFTGSIVLQSISTSPQGVKATTKASGTCSAANQGQRKF